MAIVKQGSTTLNAGAKGDIPSFTINSTPVVDGSEIVISGGAGDAVTVAITTQAELINVANANKVLSIQANITLDADISIPDGAILEYGGGTIDVNGYKVLFQNNGFGEMNAYDKLFDFSYFGTATQGTTLAGGETEWELTQVVDIHFPVRGVVNGTQKVVYDAYKSGFTNPVILFQDVDPITTVGTAFDTIIVADDVLVVTYTPVDMCSRVDDNSTFKTNFIWAKWFGLTDTSESPLFDNRNVFRNILKIGKDGVINVNAGHYYISVVHADYYKADRPNLTIKGETHLIGQGHTKTKIEALPNEITVRTGSKTYMFAVDDAPKGSVENIWLKGDLETTENKQNEWKFALGIGNLSHGFEVKNNRLSHASDGLIADNWVDFNGNSLVFETGTIDNVTGIDEASSLEEARSGLLNISTKALDVAGHVQLNLSGFGGIAGLTDFSYKLYWYNDLNEFLGATDWVVVYKRVQIPEGATKHRVVIPRPVDNIMPTGWMMSGNLASIGVIVYNNEIDHNFRDGVSNGKTEWKFLYNNFHDNGGITAGPGFAINLEDGYLVNSEVMIHGNTFENNHAGDISLRWSKDTHITNNLFIGNNKIGKGNTGFNARETWDVIVENNKFYGVDVQAGRYCKIRNNVFENSNIQLCNVYSELSNNVIYNGKVTRNGDATAAYGLSLSRNNDYIITRQRPQGSLIFGADIKSENDRIIYRNGVTVGNQDFNSGSAYTTLTKDYYKGLKVIDSIPESTFTGLGIEIKDIQDSEFSSFTHLRGGQNLDITWENNKFTDKVMMTSSASPFSTDGSDFKEWLIDGGKITSSNNTYVGASGGFSVWNTAAVDLNITFKNFTFDLTDMTEAYLFSFLHNGTVLFENCIFKANSAITSDMTRLILGSPSINCGTMTFKDCNWINITPTYRVGDIVITTPTNEVVQ